jgi:hypothetical protein
VQESCVGSDAGGGVADNYVEATSCMGLSVVTHNWGCEDMVRERQRILGSLDNLFEG